MSTYEIITAFENAKVHLEGGDPVEACSCLHLVMLHVAWERGIDGQKRVGNLIHKAHNEAEMGDEETSETLVNELIYDLKEWAECEWPARDAEEIAAQLHEEKVDALIALIWPRLDAGESKSDVLDDVQNVIDSWEPK